MFTARIKTIKREELLEDKSEFLSVEVEILDQEGKSLEVRKLGFPVDTPEAEIKAEVKKFVLTYEKDEELKKVDIAKEKRDKKINLKIKNLTGKAI